MLKIQCVDEFVKHQHGNPSLTQDIPLQFMACLHYRFTLDNNHHCNTIIIRKNSSIHKYKSHEVRTSLSKSISFMG
jgi:hypothetical protein